MDEHYCNSYYALVWSTTLNENVVVKGELLDRSVVLPKDPMMLYGTNSNDVLVVKNIEYETVIEYDVMSTEQRVRFIEIVEEISIPRDIRIIVWSGSDELEIARDSYRIVTPRDFEDMVEMASSNLEVGSSYTDTSDIEVRGSLRKSSIEFCNETLRKLPVRGRLKGSSQTLSWLLHSG